MEALLDAAAQVAAADGGHQIPNLPVPAEYLAVPTDDLLEIRDTWEGRKGKGYYGRGNIAAGTLLLVAKPVALAMDWEDDSPEIDVPVVEKTPHRQQQGDGGGDEDDAMQDDDDDDDEDAEVPEHHHDDDDEPRLNELLLIRILEKIRDDPGLWERSLSMLFPRDANDLASLPAWVVKEDDVFVKVEAAMQALQQIPEIMQETAKEISRRLPHIIRYNILSVETCSELLSYPGLGLKNLSAVGLYTQPSFFNHSRHPNCNRFAIGDVMFFVANRPIAAGDEVCISYIEHDVLAESAYRRNCMLSMNFVDVVPGESTAAPPAEVDGPEYPVVDPDLQNELMAMDPFERLTSIDELMGQATGAKPPEDGTTSAIPEEEEDGVDEDGDDAMKGTTAAASNGGGTNGLSTWFQCDVHNLRILKAITLGILGQAKEALAQWEECVTFCDTKLPPLDESSIVLRVQAALSAWHAGEPSRARQHADAALATHKLLFGGGTARFRRRLQSDFALRFRPESTTSDPVQELWPL